MSESEDSIFLNLNDNKGISENYGTIFGNDSYNYLLPKDNQTFCEIYGKIMHLALSEVFICAFGLILNGIALFVIIRLKDYKKIISHWYVLHLTIADVLLLLYLPFQAHQHFLGYWNLPNWLCPVNQGLFLMSFHAGILFLTVMSFDRYVAICHPISARWREIRTHENAIITSVAVWILSIILSWKGWRSSKGGCSCGYSYEPEDPKWINESAFKFYSDDFQNDPEYYLQRYHDLENILNARLNGGSVFYACRHREDNNFKTLITFNFALTFVIPFAFMVVCYSLILWRVLHPAISTTNSSSNRRRIASDSSNRKESLSKSSFRSTASSISISRVFRLSRKQKVTLVVVCLVACFLICWSPYHFWQLVKFYDLLNNEDQCRFLGDFFYLLACSNSMLNPIFYTFLGSDFRQRFRSATQFYLRRRRSSGFSKPRSFRTSGLTHGKSYGSGRHNKVMEGPTIYPMQSIHSMVSKRCSHDSNERSQMLSTKNKDFLTKSDAEILQISDVPESRLIR